MGLHNCDERWDIYVSIENGLGHRLSKGNSRLVLFEIDNRPTYATSTIGDVKCTIVCLTEVVWRNGWGLKCCRH